MANANAKEPSLPNPPPPPTKKRPVFRNSTLADSVSLQIQYCKEKE